MEEANIVPFFGRLRTLCREVDKNIAILNEDLSIPPGSAPQFYDRGLNALKNDIKEMKTKSEEMKKVQASVQNFSPWLQSMQDLVSKQADDIISMENYLVKFGYVPMEKPEGFIGKSSASNKEPEKKENVCETKKVESTIEVLPTPKPPLGQQVQKKVTNQPRASAKKDNCAADVINFQKTPVSSKAKFKMSSNRSALIGSYNNSKISCTTTVERWLQGIEECSIEVTPDVLRVKRLPIRAKHEVKQMVLDEIDEVSELKPSIEKPEDRPSLENEPEIASKASEVPSDRNSKMEDQIPKCDQTPVGNTPRTRPPVDVTRTPVEPVLSEYTTQFLSLQALAAKNSKIQSVKKSKATMDDKIEQGNTDTLTLHNREKGEPQQINVNKVSSEVERSEHRETLKTSNSEMGRSSNSCQTPVNNHLRSCHIDNSATPVEPELSEYTCQFLSLRSLGTKPKASSNPESNSEFHEKLQPSCIDKSSVIHSQRSQHKDPGISRQGMPSSYQSLQHNTKYEEDKTPEEPVLSYQIPLRDRLVQNTTPEEPVLSYQMPLRESKVQSRTPDEPVLSYQQRTVSGSQTPEEPVLSNFVPFQLSSSTDTKTPEEPVLSYQYSRNTASKNSRNDTPDEPVLSSFSAAMKSTCSKDDDDTPEEPILSSFASKMQSSSARQSESKYFDDIPDSPELSDITMSILSLKNQSSTKDWSNKYQESSKREEPKYSFDYERSQPSRIDRNQLSHLGSQRAYISKQENIRTNATNTDKKTWHRPGVSMEDFLGIDDIPPTPEMSDTTRRLFARKF